MRPLIRRPAIAAIGVALVVSAVLVASAYSGATDSARPLAGVSADELDSATLAFKRVSELLHELPLPPGSRSLGHRPSFGHPLSGPPQSPAVKTLVDRHAFWAVPLAPGEAVAWIAAHEPHGWRVSERGGTSSYGGQESWELGLTPPGGNLAETAVLVTAVVGGHGRSLVRVDAQAVWYPPRPKGSLVPLSARQLTVAVAPERRGADRPGTSSSSLAPVTDPSKVRSVVLAVNRLHVNVDTVESCVAIPVPAMYVWLSFRERPGGPVLAEARLSPYECSGGGSAVLRVRGHRAPPLGGGVRLIGEIERVLGMKLKGLHRRFSRPRPRPVAVRPTHGHAIGGHAIAPPLPNGPDSVPKSRILAIALGAAKDEGDPRPTLIQHVLSTHKRAVRVTSGGDLVQGEEPVYAIEVRGRFVAANASRPLGARAPRGSVLTLVIDASTGKPLDWGLSDKSAHLERLGRVVVDLRAR